MVLKQRWGQRWLLQASWNTRFNYLTIYRDDIKTLFSGFEAKPSNVLILKLAIWSIVENSFKVILSSSQYSERLKRVFLIFAKFKSWQSDEVQIVFQERETKLSRPLFSGSILENGLKANFRKKRLNTSLRYSWK